jgi:hypothetical protein
MAQFNKKKYMYWFVNSCDYSKWVDVTRIKSVSFESVERVLSKLFNKMGIPLEYKTDNGSLFQSYDFDLFARKLGFKHRLVKPYWPRANATAENVMRKLKRVLKIPKLESRKQDSVLQHITIRHIHKKSFKRVFKKTEY